MLVFPDDTQVSVNGLDDIMTEVYFEGKEVNDDTVEEIIRRLELKKNYIPSSERARKDYFYVLMKEYRKYVKEQKKNQFDDHS